MFKATRATDMEGEDSTQFAISLTTSSAVTESCMVTVALNTTVCLKFLCDPRQLKVSLSILNVQEHLGVIYSVSCNIMSPNFCRCLFSCIAYANDHYYYNYNLKIQLKYVYSISQTEYRDHMHACT